LLPPLCLKLIMSSLAIFVPFDNANSYRTTALRRVQGVDGSGKVYVVTGATGGLGYHTCLALFTAGATVVVVGRSLKKIEATIGRVKAAAPDAPGTLDGSLTLDLLDYDSIKAFASSLGKKYPKIFCLMNNASMLPAQSGYKESKYGIETTFQANFFGTILLVELVLPLLEGVDGSRIVSTASGSHAMPFFPIKFETMPSTRETFGGYDKEYCETKWLLVAYMASLKSRYDAGLTTVLPVCADPGASPDSEMWDEQTLAMRVMARYVFYRLMKTPTQAAACQVHLAVAPTSSVVPGGYYHSGVTEQKMRNDTEDPVLWAKAVEMLKTHLPAELHASVAKV